MPTRYQIAIYGSLVAAILLFRFNYFDPKTVELRQNVHARVGDHSTMPPPSPSSSLSSSSLSSSTSLPGYGYINLSCPYEMSKYSCAYMMTHSASADDDDGGDDTSRAMMYAALDASTDYYLGNIDAIQSTFRIAANQRREQRRPRRVFFTGDSLMRQLFIAIACNAMSSLPRWGDLIEYAAFPWKDEWKCGPNSGPCLIMGGRHSGFDSASIMLSNDLEIHFVPHMGYVDDDTAENGVLERLRRDIVDRDGRITFGTKTAVPMSPHAHVDVLVYNVGIHYKLERARTNINHFINWISRPLMTEDDEQRRTRTIYVTTPTQHYNTNDGQWQGGSMGKVNKVCIDSVHANPRAELEKSLLKPGYNVDVLLDYDDLNLGIMHVQRGNDCTHYCMPGVPDVVAARLMKELLI
ncbi:hypothetical protein ACHAW5_004705 [Stephanodiscus triporus]|uniref:SGNH hydrolase-type esterase domain-containing protein n=1 Tax=Stephanodiscus triporus TaxID=2934178 RepID=A0ABD3MF22_9STRA